MQKGYHVWALTLTGICSRYPVGCLLLLSISLLLWILPVGAQAVETDPTVAKQKIAEVLAEPEFKTTIEEEVWEYQGDVDWSWLEANPSSEDNSILAYLLWSFASGLELLLWLTLGIVIALVLYYIQRWLPKNLPETPESEQGYVPASELRKWSEMQAALPTDIPAAVRELWQAGQREAALSLLYRGALAVMVSRDGLEVRDSATEGECLRLVKRHQSVEISAYFARLTRLWQGIAYAHRLPADLDIEGLCGEWGQCFMTEASR